MSTTLVNAYVGPPIVRYVDRLEETLSVRRVRARAALGHLLRRGRHPGGASRHVHSSR